MKNKTILITGASGFIGSALVKRLITEEPGTKLVLLSRGYTFPEYSDNRNIVPVIGDINNLELLVYLLKLNQVTHVFHFASEAIVSKYVKNPRQAYLDTVQGVTSLLEAVRLSYVPIEKVIVSTSYKVYGNAEPPYNEETNFFPGNTYETAKACQDFIAQDYYRSFDVPVIIFRTVNVYGPGDRNESRLIPRSFSSVYKGEQPEVYSSFRDSMREFVYIDDVIDAVLLLFAKAKPGDIYCVGGYQHTIYEVVKTICDVTGFKNGVKITETEYVKESKEHSLDSSKIIELGWEKKTTLQKGLEKIHNQLHNLL